MQTDADLAFASSTFDADQTEIFARFAAFEYDLDREHDYRPDLAALTLLAATDLAYRKWIASGRRSDPVKDISDALEIAEPAARLVLSVER
mgnify:FL=1